MTLLARDRDNLTQFTAVMNKAYRTAKTQGLIPLDKISVYDKLMAVGPVYTGQTVHGGWSQPIHVHRRWRKRAARLYRREHGRAIGGFFDEIDWSAVMTWIMENIVPLLEMLFMFLPFLI